MSHAGLTFALVGSFLVAAVHANPPAAAGLTSPQGSENVKTLAAGNNQFAFDLYARLGAQTDRNLFFSPYSISTALAMTEAGAKGETAKQMSHVLHFSLPPEQLPAAFAQIQQQIVGKRPAASFQLRIANRLWGEQGIAFVPKYLQITKDDFGAELGQVDFAKDANAARAKINAWVEQQTEHKIKDLLPAGAVDRSTRLVLTNAIYFKSSWQHEFHKSATADGPFHTGDKTEQVPLMRQTRDFSYTATDAAQFLELPYGLGDLGMVIILPTKVDGLAAVEKQLSSDDLAKTIAKMQSRRVNVTFPKVKLTQEFSLAEELSALGMKLPFTTQADFSGISTQEPLLISAVIHKAFVDVNEEGTAAAAATGIAMVKSAIRVAPEPPVEFKADHPFMFVLRDHQTGSILFMGRVANPK
ncbi:MAG TPA: serpin family protein [Pirellulales bacterium]|jgi:serpin B|nr:serpin family protein [Pirellulales bacterium]